MGEKMSLYTQHTQSVKQTEYICGIDQLITAWNCRLSTPLQTIGCSPVLRNVSMTLSEVSWAPLDNKRIRKTVCPESSENGGYVSHA